MRDGGYNPVSRIRIWSGRRSNRFHTACGNASGRSRIFGAYEVTSNGGIGDQDAARNSLKNLGGTAVPEAYTIPRINFGPNDGHFFGANSGGNVPNTDFKHPGNDISMVAQGYINIPVAGTYTFGVNSDDGFTLAFPGCAFSAVTLPSTDAANPAKLQTYNGVANGAFQFYGGRGNQDSLAAINLPAGPVPVQLTFPSGRRRIRRRTLRGFGQRRAVSTTRSTWSARVRFRQLRRSPKSGHRGWAV